MTVSNALFRKLQDFEIEDLKAYARKTYVPGTDINGLFHPVYRVECELMNLEAVQSK
jgi:hypothetical protein